MHELSLSQSFIRLADRCAADAGADRILRIVLDIGAGAAVEIDALRFCFETIAEGTRAEGAELVIEVTPVKLKCRACGTVYQPQQPQLPEPCPECGKYAYDCLEGRGMSIRNIEVED